MTDQEFNHEALKVVERANELLDEVEGLREERERSREMIESAKQMRIAADGYISTLEKANKALAECVNGALEEMERLQKVNKEIARAAEVMAQISKTLERVVREVVETFSPIHLISSSGSIGRRPMHSENLSI